ncbi:MAG: N-acetylglucosamine-6-phosphate deacetylase [Clostridium sp.]|nr:N-acetylglucosamine-6-phosphate deacetylase [Clostridium sp.]MDU7085878.1 N-acetylglucosamine-6-phosphate deacetylase [Clostridium sp.]
MIIKNAKVFTEGCEFVTKDIFIKDGIFVDSLCENTSEEVIDGEGLYAIPGLIDIHLHGAMGYDFCDGTNEATEIIAKFEASQGVTAFTPATLALDEEELYNICKESRTYENAQGSEFLGIHLEGPFLSPGKKGAHAEKFLKKPDVNVFNRLNEASGEKIKIVTIAPDLEGAMEFIEELKDKTILSLGHSAANYDTAVKAFEKGACHVTHLYNAMAPMLHRDPGIIGAAADTENCYVELISDGIHCHPNIVRSTFKLFGDDHIILISDSMRATGMTDGTYTLGGLVVTVVGSLATLTDGTIAGSATSLMNCLRKAVSFGVPLESAVKCATMNPAKEIGVFDAMGSITSGKKANLVLLDKNLNISDVYINGHKYYSK